MRRPDGVTAILSNGLRIPCAVVDNGRDKDGTPKFRIVAEGIDWGEHIITVIEVKNWPGGTALAVDLPHLTPQAADVYASQIRFIDLTSC